MDVETKIELIKQVGEEILTIQELKELLETKNNPICYDGFEPSGKIHIAQGLLRAINTNKLIKAGCKFKFWVADWFALMNNKMDGNLENIQTMGEYFIEVWKACGMDLKNVEFLWSNEVLDDKKYWMKTINIARNSTVKRIIRCSQIMGRSESESLSAAQIFYPCMQCADIFHLEVDIAQLGMDQRKVNVLAREVAEKLNYKKPIAIHNHMLAGLLAPSKNLQGIDLKIEKKMSKSKPDTAIFMHDTTEEIKRKINKAYCPEKIVEDNPILEYCKYLIFEKFESFEILRPQKWGGDLKYDSFYELEKDYLENKIHPMDLKNSCSKYLDEMIKPIRDHFEKDSHAKNLLEKVKEISK